MGKSDYRWCEDTDDEMRLPAYGEDVIVLLSHLKGMSIAPHYKICFAHRIDPEEVICGMKPFTYGKGGWNVDGVAYWMPCPEIPYN